MGTNNYKYAGRERRDFPRIKGMLLEYSFSEEGMRTPAFIKNISAGGLCFILNEKIVAGEELYLYIYTSTNKRPVELIGEIVWVKETGMPFVGDRNIYEVGVEFLDGNFLEYQNVVEYLMPHYPAA